MTKTKTSLVHTWFVQYNPCYLVSAACVLVGVYLVSDGLSREMGLGAELWLTVVTELYQALLIGGAAILYRIGQRRPAVMLALLEVAYLGDLTFQNGAAAYLGVLGMLASMVWLALALLKIRVLAWALRLRLPTSVVVLTSLGALSIAALPHLLLRLPFDARIAAGLVGFLVFALGAVKLWSKGEIRSHDALPEWGRTVLGRSVTATWAIWAAMLVAHALWWSAELDIPALLPVLAAVGLLCASRAREELTLWAAAALAIGASAWLMPGVVSYVALMATVVFGLRGWLGNPAGDEQIALPPVPNRHPYRTASEEPVTPDVFRRRVPGPPRLLVGAAICAHLWVWTLGWSGGAWPAHQLWLDLSLTVVLGVLLLRRRVRLSILPLLFVHLHHLVQSRLVSAPATKLQWGVWLLALGFGLLCFGVLVSYLLRHRLLDGGYSDAGSETRSL
jgi:hypothetical protein